MSKISATVDLRTGAAPAKRRLYKILLDRVFIYGVTGLAIVLAFRSIYVFLAGNWTLAEGLATAAKLLAIIATTYFIRTRYAK